MAEAAGIALSAIGIAALFNNALECFQLYRVGQAFGQDFETYQIRLDLLQLRLSQWGEAVGLDKVGENDKLPFDNINLELAQRALDQIVSLFDKATTKVDNHDPAAAEANPSAKLRNLCGKMHGLSVKRMNKAREPSMLTKTKWALIGRKEVDDLVKSISDLLTEFIAAFPTDIIKKQEELCIADAAELRNVDQEAFTYLKNAMSEQDKQLRDALEKVGAVTHHNTNTFSGENRGVQLGQNYGTQENRFGGS